MYFAVIENNRVSNLIVADSKAIAEETTGARCVEYDPAVELNIGWTYDGEEFSNPNEVTA